MLEEQFKHKKIYFSAHFWDRLEERTYLKRDVKALTKIMQDYFEKNGYANRAYHDKINLSYKGTNVNVAYEEREFSVKLITIYVQQRTSERKQNDWRKKV